MGNPSRQIKRYWPWTRLGAGNLLVQESVCTHWANAGTSALTSTNLATKSSIWKSEILFRKGRFFFGSKWFRSALIVTGVFLFSMGNSVESGPCNINELNNEKHCIPIGISCILECHITFKTSIRTRERGWRGTYQKIPCQNLGEGEGGCGEEQKQQMESTTQVKM